MRPALQAACEALTLECAASPAIAAAACSQQGALLVLARCSGTTASATYAETIAGTASALLRGLHHTEAAAVAAAHPPSHRGASSAAISRTEPPGLRSLLWLLRRDLCAHFADSLAVAAIAAAMVRSRIRAPRPSPAGPFCLQTRHHPLLATAQSVPLTTLRPPPMLCVFPCLVAQH